MITADELHDMIAIHARQLGWPTHWSDDFWFWDLMSLRQTADSSDGASTCAIVLREHGSHFFAAKDGDENCLHNVDHDVVAFCKRHWIEKDRHVFVFDAETQKLHHYVALARSSYDAPMAFDVLNDFV